MSFDYTARIRIAIGLLIFFALLSNLRLLRDWVQFDLSFVGHDDITTYQKRFDRIRPMLPEHGIVGYTGIGLNHAHYELSDAGSMKNWFVAQYTLAPVVLSITGGNKITIMNGNPDPTEVSPPDRGSPAAQDLGNGYKLIDYGDGLKLLTQEF
jgi:hypothetical protein